MTPLFVDDSDEVMGKGKLVQTQKCVIKQDNLLASSCIQLSNVLAGWEHFPVQRQQQALSF